MGFLSPPPKRRNFNRNNIFVAAVDLHNHPYSSLNQLYHQEIPKTRQKWLTSRYSAFSTNDVRRVTMTQSSSLPLPLKTYPVVLPSLIQEESALICWKWIDSDQDRGNCVFQIPTVPTCSSLHHNTQTNKSIYVAFLSLPPTNITFLSLQTRTNGRLRHLFSSPTVPCPLG